MVKSVVGDEIRLKLAEERLFGCSRPAEVGLVIGKLSSSLDRGYVFDLIPTPSNDAGEPPCSLVSPEAKKASSSKGKNLSAESSHSLAIDSDWVSEHARQVSPMLLGGMAVLGIYIWATENAFKASTTALWQVVKGVAEATSVFERNLDKGLLVQISYSPRKLTCRNCMLGSNFTSTSLRPCDFKMARVLGSLQTFRCLYNFKLRLPVFHDSKGSTLRDILNNGISSHAEELKLARAIVDGNLVAEDQLCTSDGLHEVELLLPFMKDSPAEACSEKEVVGVLVFSGSVCSFAYLNPRESIPQAVAHIKEDIITSLHSRLNIIYDEVDEEINSTIDSGKEASIETTFEKSTPQLVLQLLRKPCTLPFPRRVLVPWLADAFICDYLQLSDTFEILQDHCKELMSMEPPADKSKLLEPETDSITLTTKSFWDVIASSYSTSGSVPNSVTNSEKDVIQKQSSTKSAQSSSFSVVAAITVLVVAIMMGLVLFILDQKK